MLKLTNRFQTYYVQVINLAHEDNGTYICYGVNAHNSDTAFAIGLVYDVPEIKIDKIVPVSSTKLFITWSVNSWNQPINVS